MSQSKLPTPAQPARSTSTSNASADTNNTPQSQPQVKNLFGYVTPTRSVGGGQAPAGSTLTHKQLQSRSSVSSLNIPIGDTPQSRSKPDVESERVKVVLRVRPALREDEHAGALQLEADGRTVSLLRPDAPISRGDFKFDKVLSPDASQHDVYTSGVKDVVDDVLNGYNGTVMAYGMTGAGKTYTLGNTEPTAIGMIPRCVAEVFKTAESDPFHNYTVSMSYIQIYMELIQDLLRPESENLAIREDQLSGVFVAGVREVQVSSLEECLLYLEQGEKNRAFAFTHLNAHSSRSHAVVMVTVVKSRKYLTAQEKADIKKTEKEGMVSQKVKVGKLYLVDLAGSERLKKSKSTGQRASEARSINLSLTTLGMCISARATDEKHVPFRDSKLTRLLQESLGGNAKTTLLVCVADVKEHVDESLQSLNFGSRAMCVKNKPVVNERMDYRVLHAELLNQMDQTADHAHELEVTILRTEEERDKLQATLEHEKVHFEGLIHALRSESEQRVATVSSQLADVRQAADKEAARCAQLEAKLQQLQADNANLAQTHYSQTASMSAQIKELQASKAAAQEAHEQAAAQAATQLSSTQKQLEQAKARGVTLQDENAALKAELAALKAAQAHTHSSLTQLQLALKASIPASLPTPPDGALLSPRPAPAAAGSNRTSWTGDGARPGNKSARGSVVLSKSRSGPPLAPVPAIVADAAAVSVSGSQAGEDDSKHLAPRTPMASVHELDSNASQSDNSTADSATAKDRTSSMGNSTRSSGSGMLEGANHAASGVTAAVQQQLGALLQQLAPQVATSIATLQEHIKVQNGSINGLQSQLSAKVKEAESLAVQLSELRKDLEREQNSLAAEKKLTTELRARVGELLALMAEQEGVLGQRQQRINKLTNQLAGTQQQLGGTQEQLAQEQQKHAGLRAAHAELQKLHARIHDVRQEVHANTVQQRARERAARTIQRAYRACLVGRVKSKASKDLKALNDLEAARQEATAVASLQSAHLGAGMVVDSMTVIREAVEQLLVTFVGTRKELEHRDKLAARVANAAPIISQARLNSTVVALRAASSVNGASPSPMVTRTASASSLMSPAIRALPSQVMFKLGSMGGSPFARKLRPATETLVQGLPPVPPSAAGPMALPRAVTLAIPYSAVAPTMLEYTNMWKPAGSILGGAGPSAQSHKTASSAVGDNNSSQPLHAPAGATPPLRPASSTGAPAAPAAGPQGSTGSNAQGSTGSNGAYGNSNGALTSPPNTAQAKQAAGSTGPSSPFLPTPSGAVMPVLAVQHKAAAHAGEHAAHLGPLASALAARGGAANGHQHAPYNTRQPAGQLHAAGRDAAANGTVYMTRVGGGWAVTKPATDNAAAGATTDTHGYSTETAA